MITVVESAPCVARQLSILGVPVDDVDMADALRVVENCVRSGRSGSYIVALNPEKIDALRRGALSSDFFERATLRIPDGIGIVLAARLLYGKRLARVAGADLMEAICAAAPAHGYRIFLYGGREEVSRAAAAKLASLHRGIRIVGRSQGFVPPGRMPELLDRIEAARPEILFVGLGSPRQERWMAEYLPQLDVPLAQGIGGTLDTIAGTVRRAPRPFRRLGLEWLYRLAAEPSRAPRHVALLRFAREVLAARLRV